MMENDEFVDNYVSDCLDAGITKPSDICAKAVERIEFIDLEVEKIQNLREERDNLQKVLKSFNHESIKSRGRKAKAPIVNLEVTEDDPAYKELLSDICSQFEKHASLTSRELLEKMDLHTEDPTPTYVAIKWLLSKGILERNESTRNLSKGSYWESRTVIL